MVWLTFLGLHQVQAALMADGGGQQSLLYSACVAACERQSWEGGSSACFACVAQLVLVSVCRVLGVMLVVPKEINYMDTEDEYKHMVS